MSGPALRWRPYGEHGVLLELGSLAAVHAAHRRAQASGLAAESVPGAETLYLEAAPGVAVDALLRVLAPPDGPAPPDAAATADATGDATDAPDGATVHIEVVYDGADLDGVAAMTGLDVGEVVRRHAAPRYTVAFLGFSRGFPYLAGLDPALVVPRLDVPRTSVPAGSVGMGAAFTGIYPMASPGGWRLLGHTSPDGFDERRDPPSVLAIGDRVRFVPVERLGPEPWSRRPGGPVPR